MATVKQGTLLLQQEGRMDKIARAHQLGKVKLLTCLQQQATGNLLVKSMASLPQLKSRQIRKSSSFIMFWYDSQVTVVLFSSKKFNFSIIT